MFLFLYNTATAIFNGLGDSRTPLYFLAFSTTFNVILDIFFVSKLNMGISGVAWATLIAQGISSLLAVVTLVRRLSRIHTTEKPKRFDRHLLGRMAMIAIPSICQQSVFSVYRVWSIRSVPTRLPASPQRSRFPPLPSWL